MLEWLGSKQVLRAHSDAQELDADEAHEHVSLCVWSERVSVVILVVWCEQYIVVEL